jgi:hypothetical protein
MKRLSSLAVVVPTAILLGPAAVITAPAAPPGGIDVNIVGPVPVPVTVDGQANVTGDVNVVNTPDVNVANSPDVNVTNLPAVQDVNVVNDSRVQVRVGAITGNDTVAATIRPVVQVGLCSVLGGCNRVPSGYKLVITDFVLDHAVDDTSGTLSANIRRSLPNQTCSEGLVDIVSLRVPQDPSIVVNPSIVANFTTGHEFLEGTQVCVSTGGGMANVVYAMYGYLTPTSANQ